MTSEYDDELRARLAELDPTVQTGPAGVPVDPATSPRASELLERIMSTDHSSPDLPSAGVSDSASRSRRRPALLAAAAAAVLVVGVGAVIATSGDDPGTRAQTLAKTPTTLALTAPGGLTMGSCVPFDVKFLRDMPVALAGTVVAADSTKVTLNVDRWYKGGDADQVTIAVPSGQTSAGLDGVDFAAGKRYLLTATDGTVNGCGFSGPASAELEKSYAEAFPS